MSHNLLPLIFVGLTASSNLNAEATTRINLSKLPPVATTSPSFLSVALDSGVVANGYWPLNFSHPQLIALAKGLGPAYLRYSDNWVLKFTSTYLGICSMGQTNVKHSCINNHPLCF